MLTREAEAIQRAEGQVVIDKADKFGSYAVVFKGNLLPVRFTTWDDADKHLSDLRAA